MNILLYFHHRLLAKSDADTIWLSQFVWTVESRIIFLRNCRKHNKLCTLNPANSSTCYDILSSWSDKSLKMVWISDLSIHFNASCVCEKWKELICLYRLCLLFVAQGWILKCQFKYFSVFDVIGWMPKVWWITVFPFNDWPWTLCRLSTQEYTTLCGNMSDLLAFQLRFLHSLTECVK